MHSKSKWIKETINIYVPKIVPENVNDRKFLKFLTPTQLPNTEQSYNIFLKKKTYKINKICIYNFIEYDDRIP